MTGFTIQIEVNEEARQALNMLVERMTNPRPFYQAAGNLLVGTVGENFRWQAAPDGAAWAPLRPATIRARQRRGRSALAILRERGILAGSIFYLVGDDGVRVGSPVKYAAIHQFGGSIDMPARQGKIYRRQMTDGSFGRRFAKKKNKTSVATDVAIGAHQITIPARPFLGISPTDQADIIALAKRWLEIG
jgi:phage virion morphogenesis protein